ncbi:MAG: EF-hand domain-containing protein [Mariprofundus sp.]|nr:EF-hand domain-containing protein [Mariprofundus sp.]
MKKHMIISIALLAFAATPALAEGMGHNSGMSGMHHMLKQADVNHDGKTTKAEFMAASSQQAEKRFAHMDANGDGVLDEKDHQAHFDKMDANHDGSISRDEFTAFHKQMYKQHHKHGGGHD